MYHISKHFLQGLLGDNCTFGISEHLQPTVCAGRYCGAPDIQLGATAPFIRSLVVVPTTPIPTCLHTLTDTAMLTHADVHMP